MINLTRANRGFFLTEHFLQQQFVLINQLWYMDSFFYFKEYFYMGNPNFSGLSCTVSIILPVISTLNRCPMHCPSFCIGLFSWLQTNLSVWMKFLGHHATLNITKIRSLACYVYFKGQISSLIFSTNLFPISYPPTLFFYNLNITVPTGLFEFIYI